MKKIKFFVVTVSFALITVFCSEIYQSYLRNFSNRFYYIGIAYNYDRRAVCESLVAAAEKENIGVFAFSLTDADSSDSQLCIYATDKMKNLLIKKYGLTNGKVRSFISGAVTVSFLGLDEIPDDSRIENYYFSGNMEQVLSAKSYINSKFSTSFVHQGEADYLSVMPIGVLCIFAVLTLIFTWMDIQYQKKTNFVLISMGESSFKLIAKNILIDSAAFTTIFSAVYIVFGKLFFTGYLKKTIFIGLAILIASNALMYLSMLKINYKEVLYGANITPNLLSNCYVIKSVSLIITIACISLNMFVIHENYRYLSMYGEIDGYDKYSFVNFTSYDPDIENFVERRKTEAQITSRFILDYMKADKVALASGNYDVDGTNVIHINAHTNGADKISALINQNDGYDFYILIPEKLKKSRNVSGAELEIAETALQGSEENYDIGIIYYDFDYSVVWFNAGHNDDHRSGFDRTSNPILIYWNRVPTGDGYFNCFSDMKENIMLEITDEEYASLEEQYAGLKTLSKTGTRERCERYKSSFSRILLLNTVISALMFLWEILNIYVIIKSEYQIDAKMLAVKKILGYGLIERNRQILLINMYAAFIGVVAVCIGNIMFGVFKWYYAFVSAAFVLLAETIFIFIFINKTEKSSIPKILKGGSL